MSAMSSHIRIPKSDQSPVSVTFPTNIISQGALPHATSTDDPSEGLWIGERSTHLHGQFYGPWYRAGINKLTDDSLLEIFDFYLKELVGLNNGWHMLVHVCRRWRDIVFASPHRLDLRLLCTKNSPVRATLDIWPVLPLEIKYDRMDTREVQDNVVAALEHHDRVRGILLYGVPSPVLGTLATVMQVQFPELTSLSLLSEDKSVPVLPDSFLGGSAPRLQALILHGVPFPAMRNLLLSTSDLVDLELFRLPHSGYISPASMVAFLSSLKRLQSFRLGFQLPRSRPNQPSPPPQTRVVLPALRSITFSGMIDYSEDFLARIDTPVLNYLYIKFFMDLVFEVPHFEQFIGRAKGFHSSKAARMWFAPQFVLLELDEPRGPTLEVSCFRIDWQLDSMARVCRQLSPFFSSIERFDLIWSDISLGLEGKDDLESTQFLEILQPFPTIRSLYVSETFLPFIAPALKKLTGESATEVLPSLCDLFLGGYATSGPTQEDIRPFIEARQLSGQPVAVHHWDGGEN